MHLLKGFVYSNVYVGFILSALTFSSYSVISFLDLRWYVILSVFLGSFTLYSFHRLYKIDFIPKDQLSERHKWGLKHANALKIAMALAVFAAMIILPNYDADAIVWLVPAAIVSVGYTVPFIPTEQKWWRLRDIPLAKPFIIAFVVTYLTLSFPLFEQFGIRSIFQPTAAQMFLERFMFILAVTIPFEIRDVISDRVSGTETLATSFGMKSAKRITGAVAVTWFVLLSWRLGIVGLWLELLPFLIILIFLLVAINAINERWHELKFVLAFEGMIAVYSAVLATLQVLA